MNSGHGLWMAVWAITVGHVASAQAQEGHAGPGLRDEGGLCDVAAPPVPEGFHVVNTATQTWPGGIVPYRFNANVTAQNQQRAVAAMESIEAVCDVDFIPWSGQAAYLFIQSANVNNSCIGYSGGVCTVNINGWPFHGLIMHEFGHSLGLYHEHQRPDRDSYVQLNLAAVCGLGTGAYTIIPGPTVFGPYDFESVMHYGRREGAAAAGALITMQPAYADWKYVIQRVHLSAGDIWTLTELYGGPRPPRSFALLSPAHRAQVGAGWVPSFQWAPAEAADSYLLQMDDDFSFTSPEINVSVEGTSHVAVAPFPDGVYFWRALAVNANGQTEARPRAAHVLYTGGSPGPVLYVDDDAAPGGSGASWALAVRDLRDALAMADCSGGTVTEIRVGQGVYTPDRGSGDRSGAFDLVGGVHVKGGYAGVGAPDPDARDISLYVTTLSGDLAGDDQPGFVNYTENSRHVVRAIGVAPACTLDGITITSGNADGVPGEQNRANGGGVFSRDSLVVLRDCRVTNCSANLAGGGVSAVDDGAFEAWATTIEGNRTTYPISGGGAGGGLNKSSGASVTLIGCTFRGNTAFQGAGANIQDAGGPNVLRDCVFEDNVASQWVGGIQTYQVVVTVDRCTFRNNRCLSEAEGYAGAFGNYGNTGCGITGVAALINCLFVGNEAAYTGGAINNDDRGTVTVVNCTIVGNIADPGRGGGLANTADFGSSSVMTIANSIVRANTGGQIVNIGATSVTSATYSNVEGGFAGTGNLPNDPLFVAAATGNYRLGPFSPCTDAANNTLVPAGITADLDGSPRFRDDPWVINTGVPGGAGGPLIADMGAYEGQESSCYADCNASGSLTVADFGCFQTQFVIGAAYADCNADGVRTVADFGCYQTRFVVGCP